MKKFLQRNRLIFSIFLIAGSIGAILETGIAFVLGNLVNAVSTQSSKDVALLTIFAILYLIPVTIFDWAHNALLYRLQTRYTSDLRKNLVESGITNPVPYRRDISRNSETFQASVINDAEMVGADYASSVFSLIYQALFLLAGLAGTAIINPIFLPVIAVLSILAMALPKLTEKGLLSSQKEVSDTRSKLIATFARIADGIESILSTGRSARMRALGIARIEELERAENHRNDLRTLVWSITWGFGMVIIVGIWGVGSIMSTWGIVSIGQVVAIAQLMTQVAGPFQSLGSEYSRIIGARKQLAGLVARMKDKEFQDDRNESSNTSNYSDGLEQTGLVINELAFCANGQEILSPVNVSIPNGARVLVTGSSGAGKSSLLRSIAGTINANGFISLNGEKITPEKNRAGRIVLATQRNFIFPGTLRENIEACIVHNDGEYTDSEKITDDLLQEFVQENAAILGPVAEQAIGTGALRTVDSLSGGEGKRVHIIRTCSGKPDVILIDEINAGIDQEAARDVLQALIHGVTPIIIAVLHDLPVSAKELGFTHELRVSNGQVGELAVI